MVRCGVPKGLLGGLVLHTGNGGRDGCVSIRTLHVVFRLRQWGPLSPRAVALVQGHPGDALLFLAQL